MKSLKDAFKFWLRYWRGPLRDRLSNWFFPFISAKNKPYFEGWVLSQSGAWFYVHTKSYIEYKIWLQGAYEPEITTAIVSFLKPDGVFIDIGANIGSHTLPVAKHLSEKGKVYAIEPIAHIRAKLEANISFNQLRNIHIIPFALADREMKISTEFNKNIANQGSFSLAHMTAGKGEIIQCIPGDAYFQNIELGDNIVIKIDVEGFEWQVCWGMQKLIHRYKPVIIMEYDTQYIKRALKGAKDYEDLFFNTLKYKLFVLKNYHLFSLNTIKPLQGMYTLLAMPNVTA